MSASSVPPRRSLFALVTAGVLLLGVVGCGGGQAEEWTPPSASRGGTAADRDPWAGADADLPERVGPRLGVEDLYERIVSAMRAAGTYTWTVDAGVQSGDGESDALLSGQVKLGPGEAVAARARSGDGTREFRWIEDTLYARDAAQTGGRWVSAPARADQGGAAARALALVDPAVLLGPLGEASRVQRDGVEAVAGVPTQRYRVRVPREAWARRAGVPASSVARPWVVILVWVDARSRLRRFRQSVPLVTSRVPEGVTTTVRGSFTDFGRRVRIEVPHAR